MYSAVMASRETTRPRPSVARAERRRSMTADGSLIEIWVLDVGPCPARSNILVESSRSSFLVKDSGSVSSCSWRSWEAVRPMFRI